MHVGMEIYIAALQNSFKLLWTREMTQHLWRSTSFAVQMSQQFPNYEALTFSRASTIPYATVDERVVVSLCSSMIWPIFFRQSVQRAILY